MILSAIGTQSPSSMSMWDKARIFEGLTCIASVRDESLSYLTDLCNDYHGQKNTLRYYDILLGDWLDAFLHLAYAAWLNHQSGVATPGQSPVPLAYDSTRTPATNYERPILQDHLQWAISQIADGKSPKSWKFDLLIAQKTRANLRSGIENRAISALGAPKPQLLICRPSHKCGQSEQMRLLWRWRQWAKRDDLNVFVDPPRCIDGNLRKALSNDSDRGVDFLTIVKTLLPLNLPTVFLEGFKSYRNAIMGLAISRPKAVYSANALNFHLPFKILSAEWQQDGTRLLYSQHGGGYGLDQIHALEDYETRVVDRFYSWGWSRSDRPVHPLPHPPIATYRKKPKWRVLLNCVDYPLMVYRIHFRPMLGHIHQLHRETENFLMELKNKERVLVRPYQHNYQNTALRKMQEAAPKVEFDSLLTSSFRRFAEAQLVVHNYLGTSYLETLALNIPTVCFYDASLYSFRAESIPFIGALEKVGILHKSGRDAALFVSDLGTKPEQWWVTSEVQEARFNFVRNYANFSPNWIELWEDEFQKQISLAD